jgi:hypothetical protein
MQWKLTRSFQTEREVSTHEHTELADVYITNLRIITLRKIQCDSKLLSVFPWPIIFKPIKKVNLSL